MTLTDLINLVTDLIAYTIPIAVALALLAFMWSAFQAFGKSDSVDGRKEARQMLLWSLIAIVVIATLGGLVALVSSTFLQ